MSSLLLHVMRLGDSNSERRFGAGFKMENKGEIRGQMLSNFLTSSCSATPSRRVGSRSKESFDSFHVHIRSEILRKHEDGKGCRYTSGVVRQPSENSRNLN
ncbi:hypothetical protein PUN28_008017 [Cardiocondyla obscurior]|uniref:Uncharacterized protein n=1 Tax=Cardiocondyla obscurior TaxID=286306 RepID=A0AAW2G0Z5_9HYME